MQRQCALPITLATWDAGLGIDAVEPVPSMPSFASVGQNRLAVVATYRLADAGARRRAGFVHLLQLSGSLLDAGGRDWKLFELTKTDDLSGVLDLRCVALLGDKGDGAAIACGGADEHETCAVVLAACADAAVRAFRIRVETGSDGACRYRLEPAWTWSCAESLGLDRTACIVLSVDVSALNASEKPAPASAVAVLTTSVGSLHVVEFTATTCVSLHCIPFAHTDSAWSATLLPSAPCDSLGTARSNYVLYSGGDDATLASWDLRVRATQPTQRFRNAHSGVGVTSVVLKNAGGNTDCDSGCFEILTGGYDDAMRLWDVRAMRTCVDEVDCGGGLWRIKEYHGDDFGDGVPSRAYLLSCMYNGFKIASIDRDNSMNIVSSYNEHDSLAYGAAWLQSQRVDSSLKFRDADVTDGDASGAPHDDMRRHGTVALTGSFYDNALHAWYL